MHSMIRPLQIIIILLAIWPVSLSSGYASQSDQTYEWIIPEGRELAIKEIFDCEEKGRDFEVESLAIEQGQLAIKLFLPEVSRSLGISVSYIQDISATPRNIDCERLGKLELCPDGALAAEYQEPWRSYLSYLIDNLQKTDPAQIWQRRQLRQIAPAGVKQGGWFSEERAVFIKVFFALFFAALSGIFSWALIWRRAELFAKSSKPSARFVTILGLLMLLALSLLSLAAILVSDFPKIA